MTSLGVTLMMKEKSVFFDEELTEDGVAEELEMNNEIIAGENRDVIEEPTIMTNEILARENNGIAHEEEVDAEKYGDDGTALEVNDLVISIERIKRTPKWMDGYVHEVVSYNDSTCFMIHEDPRCFDEAVKQQKWKVAMDLEIEAIEKN